MPSVQCKICDCVALEEDFEKEKGPSDLAGKQGQITKTDVSDLNNTFVSKNNNPSEGELSDVEIMDESLTIAELEGQIENHLFENETCTGAELKKVFGETRSLKSAVRNLREAHKIEGRRDNLWDMRTVVYRLGEDVKDRLTAAFQHSLKEAGGISA